MLKIQNDLTVAGREADKKGMQSMKKVTIGANIDLDKIDEFGRIMTPKEAFREISHK